MAVHDEKPTDLSVAPVVGPDDPRRFTDSGIEVEPIYGPDDLPADLDLGAPGEFPFTRGIHPEMYRKRPWTIRQYAGYATAKESNERYKYLLKNGSTGLSMAFDLPTQLGLDSDDPRCLGEVGRTGVAIDTIDDMRTAFDGIPLDEVSTSMTINAPASVLLLLYELVAAEQGVESQKLRGTVQNDILKEYIARGNFIYPPEPSMRLTTDLFAYCRERIPKWNTVSISGYHFREKGASAVQEVAFTLASGMAYVQAALDAGLKVDDFAPRLAFFFNGHNNVFQEVAKFRAARNMWAHAMKERFGAQDPKSMMLRFHTQTGGVTLTAQQPQNNVVRVALQAFAAVCGGTQSLHTNGYDEALALPSERAAKIALRTQQIVAAGVRRHRHGRPVRGLLLRRVAHRRDRAPRLEADRARRRAGRLGQRDRVHQERDRGVGLRLPRALPHRAGRRRRREPLRRGRRRGRGDPVGRPGHRARADRAPEGVQGRARPGARRPPARGAARGGGRERQPARADPRGAGGPLLGRRGVRRDARRLRRVPAGDLMRAVVSTPGGERRAELRDVPVPEAGPGEVLVRVHAAGINRGELTLVEIREDFRPGQEVAGVVAAGPREGERVVGLADWHGWAEYATVPEHRLVTLPDAIGFATAAALPMAGTTALNLIRLGGDLLGRDVTVTGASGGVGVIAVQLARLAGANVTAVSAVTEDSPDGQDLILESAGGTSLDQAVAKVAAGGLVLVFGNSSKERSTIDFRDFAGRDAARVQAFYSAAHEHKAADNLRTLLGLVGDGALQVQVGLETPLAEVNDALDALAARQVPGKAILLVAA